MINNKFAVKSIEQQQLKSTRKYYLTIRDINAALGNVHKHIHSHLDLQKYQNATDYIHQYISHTTVWNMKFVMNLESPEVALLQIFHLNYIFKQEPETSFTKERAILKEQEALFYSLDPYKEEHIERRLQGMLAYIHQKEIENQ